MMKLIFHLKSKEEEGRRLLLVVKGINAHSDTLGRALSPGQQMPASFSGSRQGPKG